MKKFSMNLLPKLSVLIIVSLVALLANPSWAASYYIKQTGNDSLTGLSDAQAWKTFNNVNSRTFNAGDRILLKRGNSWNQQMTPNAGNGTSGNKIIIDAYGSGNNPVIYRSNPQTDTCIYIYNKSHWGIRNIDFLYALYGVYVINSPETHTYDIDVMGCNFTSMNYINQSPPVFGSGVVFGAQGYYHDLYVGGCTFNGCCQSVAVSNATNVQIDSCTMWAGVSSGIGLENCNGGTINNCNIHDMGTWTWNGSCGIYFGRTSYVTIQYTTVANIHNDGGGDGCALDFEYNNYWCNVISCNFNGCEGAGIETCSSIHSQGQSRGIWVYDTFIAYNNNRLGIAPRPYSVDLDQYNDQFAFDTCHFYLGNGWGYWDGMGEATFNNCDYQ